MMVAAADRIKKLNGDQDTLKKRLQAIESRVIILERTRKGGLADASAPLLEQTDMQTRVAIAAWELEDALHDRMLPKETMGEDDVEGEQELKGISTWFKAKEQKKEGKTKYPKNIIEARKDHVNLLKSAGSYNWAVICLVILTFVEVPPWCHSLNPEKNLWNFAPGYEWCKLPSPPSGNSNPNLSGLTYLPPGYAFIVEILIECVIMYYFAMEWSFERDHIKPIGDGKPEVLKTKISHIGVFLAVGSIIDTGVFMFWRMPFRLTFIFRTGLVFLLPTVQHPFWNIFNKRVLTEFMSVGVFFIGTVFFFAWIGVTTLSQADDVSFMDGEEKVHANKGLTNMQDAVNTMFVGGVTGEFIDCYLPSFVSYRPSGALWMVYLLLTQVLFKNLVMDTLITAYLNGYEVESKRVKKTTVRAMSFAFDLLSVDGQSITRETYYELVKALAMSPRWTPIPTQAAELIYDKFGGVTRENWVDIVNIFQNELWLTQREGPIIRSLGNSPGIQNMLKANVWSEVEDEPPRFDKIMNKVLMFNLVLVFVESVYDYRGWAEPGWFDMIDIVFSFVYLGEVCIKLMAKSFGEYWSDGGNRFDFFTTWLLLFTSLIKYLPKDFMDIHVDLSHYANILRLLRLIRILKQLKSFKQVKFMLNTITRIVSEANEVLALMGTFFFFFCTLAVNLFGGLLYEGNEALEGSEYAEKHWYILNFNDMFMALMTWFVQILCEYVPNYSDALRRTATAQGLSYGPYAGTIVFFFYLTTAAIMYELLLAFTVEVFMAVKEEEPEEHEKEAVGASKMLCSPAKMCGLKDCLVKMKHIVFSETEAEEKEDESEKTQMVEQKRTLRERGSSEKKEEEEESDEEEEFDAEKFLLDLESKFDQNDLDLHWSIKNNAELLEELEEAWEKKLEEAEEMEGEGENKEEAEGKELEGWEVVKAGWLFENGIYHEDVTMQLLNNMDPSIMEKARDQHMQLLKVTKWFYVAIVFLIILTLVEVPAWCHQVKMSHLGLASLAAGTEWCAAPDPTADLNLSGIWYLPPLYAFIVEVIIEAIIFYKFYLEKQLESNIFTPIGRELEKGEEDNTPAYINARNTYAGLFFSIGSIVDTALFMLFHDWFYTTRLTFIFRTGLLCLLPGVQRLYKRIFARSMLEQFASVAVFFVGTVLFFAWIAVTIYRGDKSVAYHAEEEVIMVNKGFETLSGAVYTMFLAGMTEGFNDIFIPSITSFRPVAFLWLIFLMLTQILFLNLVIDAFVYAYLKGSENHIKLQAYTQSNVIFSVAEILFQGESLSEANFCKFVAEISRSPRMRSIAPELAKEIFMQFGDISKERFIHACTLIQNPMWLAPKYSSVKVKAPEVWNGEMFKKLRLSVCPVKIEAAEEEEELGDSEEAEAKAPFDTFMEWILFFNMIYVVCQSFNVKVPIHGLGMFFTLIYVFEVFVKLMVRSWATYWSTVANRFDFYTTWLLFASTMLKYLPIAGIQQGLSHYANILRLLRLVRVVKNLKRWERFQFMVRTTVRMVESATDILMILMVVVFFFTTFSVNFFGGLLYEGNDKLEGSDYKEKSYYVFNFNDCIMGFVTWFTQLLCEYAPEWADALGRTSQFGWITWYIFPVFYLLGVAIVFEILKAFTIETYLALTEEEEEKKSKREKEEKKKKKEKDIKEGKGEEDAEESESESESESSSDEEEFEETPDVAVLKEVADALVESNFSLHVKPNLQKRNIKEIKKEWEKELEKMKEKKEK